MKKGELLTEEVVRRYIQDQVDFILDSDCLDTVNLFNYLHGKRRIAMYESEGGEPLDEHGKVVGCNEAGVYLCIEGD
jgi:hypothetical protein